MAEANPPGFPGVVDQTFDGGDSTVIQAVMQYAQEAEDARIDRMRDNKRNRDAFLGRQDFSHKVAGQSREFLPKVPVSVEQMAAFVKRGLIQFGDWFSVDLDRSLESVVTPQQVAHVLKVFLENLWDRNNVSVQVATIISDAVKVALLESLMIVKVHGGYHRARKFHVEPGELTVDVNTGKLDRAEKKLGIHEVDEWRLRIDLVRAEDYLPDPTGNGLYEIHRVERDLHEVLEAAASGLYDERVVKELIAKDYPRPDDEKRSDQARNQTEATTPSFRKRVVLDEFWGTILNSDGTVAYENIVCTIANGKYLIRPPEPNPFWHQESPFVVAPLVRVPWSVWHKALYDHASSLNLALNEMFNLMLDGGISAVWGIKQVRLDDMDDPNQVSGGIQQGMTIAVKSTLPIGGKVVETVSDGQVPQDAMAIFEFLNREFTMAAMTNELKLGSLPGKEVRATEVMEASSSQAVTLDGILADVEASFITPMLRKAFLTLLQNADSIPERDMLATTSKRLALILMRSAPAERYALFAGGIRFRAHGLSATMARARDFQRMMALMQASTSNPLLFQAFAQKFSPAKILDRMMKALNINPEDIEMDPEEAKALPGNLAALPSIVQLLGGPQPGAQGGQRANGTGVPGMQEEVAQLANPQTGMAPNG